ncbi:MAG: hypothetical protein QOJ67_2025 [Acidimicrobiaceae bacterium]
MQAAVRAALASAAVAPTIDSIIVADPPDAWRAAGFAVDDEDVCCIGTVRIELVGPDRGKRIVGWTVREVPDGPLDGLPTTPSDRPPCAPGEHPNGTRTIDHLVVVSPDVDRTVQALSALGIEPRRTRLVDPEQYGFSARQTFFRMGEVILELIGGEEPTGDGDAAFFGLAYTVADLDATQKHLGPLLPNVKDAVQPGRRIGTLRHKELGMSVATAFMSPGASDV